MPKKFTNSDYVPQAVKISQIAENTYFRRKPDAKKTYVRAHYCKAEKVYAACDFDNVGREIFLKGATLVYLNIDF